jgi:hypothetical protein
MVESTRFAIRFDSWYCVLSSVLLIPPSASYVEIQGDQVHVRMSWAFRATFPRAAVISVTPSQARPISRGVHGLAGRWLVNGSSQGILTLDLEPAQRGHVMGIPIRLRQLLVSLDDPDGLQKMLLGDFKEGVEVP